MSQGQTARKMLTRLSVLTRSVLSAFHSFQTFHHQSNPVPYFTDAETAGSWKFALQVSHSGSSSYAASSKKPFLILS